MHVCGFVRALRYRFYKHFRCYNYVKYTSPDGLYSKPNFSNHLFFLWKDSGRDSTPHFWGVLSSINLYSGQTTV